MLWKPERYVADADILQGFERLSDFGHVEKFQRLAGRQAHHLVDVPALVGVREGLAAVTVSAAVLADDYHRLGKRHVVGYPTRAAAGRTAAFRVETQVRSVNAVFLGEKFSDFVGNARVGGSFLFGRSPTRQTASGRVLRGSALTALHSYARVARFGTANAATTAPNAFLPKIFSVNTKSFTA